MGLHRECGRQADHPPEALRAGGRAEPRGTRGRLQGSPLRRQRRRGHPDRRGLLASAQTRQRGGATVSRYHPRNACGGLLSDFTTFNSSFAHRPIRSGAPSLFSSQCALIERRDLFKVGGFDERFRLPTVEDIELGLRLVDAGIPVTVVPEAVVIHHSRYTPSTFVMNYVLKGFDFGWVMRQRHAVPSARCGYGGIDDLVSLGLVGALALSLVACGRGLPPAAWLFPLGALLFHWRRFVGEAWRCLGAWEAVWFLPLRAAALVLSSAAACAGAFRSPAHPAPWHRR